MTRCDSESVFYKVFCIGLLIIAFTFTIILTNVFIDIDGLLTRKEKEQQNDVLERATTEFKNPSEQQEYGGAERNYDDGDGAYRTKRSLDSNDFLLHIKNPKMKSILTNRLIGLLEELDEEDTKTHKKEDKSPVTYKRSRHDDIYGKTVKSKEKTNGEHTIKNVEVDARKNEQSNNNNVLHLAMHNILLQGIIGHMDLNEVYTKVHELLRNFNNNGRKQLDEPTTTTETKAIEIVTTEESNTEERTNEATTEALLLRTPSLTEESKFLEELIKCEKLRQDISDIKKNPMWPESLFSKTPKFLIKTQIDIQKDNKEMDPNSREDIKSIIKLIYNGKPVKVKNIEEEDETTATTIKIEKTTVNTVKKDVEEIADLLKVNFQNKRLPKEYMNTVLTEYLKKYTNAQKLVNEKRLKRNTEVNNENIEKDLKKQGKKDDDELFVEIETHFDNKGLKGKKKKELIKQLIDKIQTALRSGQGDKKKLDHLQELRIRKRIQNPLARRNNTQNALLKKLALPYDYNLYRELYPIAKVAPDIDPTLKIADENGENWKKKDTGPKFFSASKSINSAELNQVNVDYNNVIKVGGVSQRLQVPLNTETSEEANNAFYDLGNLQFLIKDIEGTGFSIGFNQYVDQAPDPESIKLFTGLENLVDTYQKSNDYVSRTGIPKNDVTVTRHEISKRQVKVTKPTTKYVFGKSEDNKLRQIFKRSISKEKDYHSNEYSVVFNENILPYNNYQEIYNKKREKISIEKSIQKKSKRKTLQKDFGYILEKKLKPSEIFGLANLLDRKKRSVYLKTINNVNTKKRMNKFLNTNAMPKQKILLKRKRSKRQIDKIRILSKDDYLKEATGSEENLFLVSDENIYADRAVIRRLDRPKFIAHAEKREENSDEEPMAFEKTQQLPFQMAEEQVQNNPLMLRYPHIFYDDVNADDLDEIPFFNVMTKPVEQKPNVEMTTENDYSMLQMPKVQDLVNALTPYPKTKVKLTVKLVPKDENYTREGFKEIHTSINKTYHKNGVLYVSLLNVSEISKIEPTIRAHINNTAEDKNNTNICLTSTITPNTVQNSPINIVTTHNCLQNKHEELTNILKQHKDMIDKQLDHLNKRKYHTNTAATEAEHNSNTSTTTEGKIDFMDILIPSNPPKKLQLSKEDLGKILLNALKAQEDAKTTTQATVATLTPTTTQTTKQQTIDPLKMKLLKSISQNEHLTSQILNKIDKNTDVLQSFLSKLEDKMHPEKTTQAADTKKREELNENVNLSYPNVHPIFLRPTNHSDMGIPFIYAKKQPYKVEDKAANPVASLIYHDEYMKPNTIEKIPLLNYDTNGIVKRNSTRVMRPQYFIDEDFFKTVISPVNDEVKPHVENVNNKDEKHKEPEKEQNVTVKRKYDFSKVFNKYSHRPYVYKNPRNGTNSVQ